MMNPAYPIWILVSDASRARLYSVDAPQQPMALRSEFEHPESRAMEKELVTDRPGRTSQSTASDGRPGHGSRSGMEPGTTAKQVEHERFARTLTTELNAEFSRNAFARLVVVANPEFLGLLRDSLSEPLNKALSASVNKDYTRLELRELEEQLAPVLAAA